MHQNQVDQKKYILKWTSFFFQHVIYAKSRNRPKTVGRKAGWGGNRNSVDVYIAKCIREKNVGRKQEES